MLCCIDPINPPLVNFAFLCIMYTWSNLRYRPIPPRCYIVTLTLCDRKSRRFKHNQWAELSLIRIHFLIRFDCSLPSICIQFQIYYQPILTWFLMKIYNSFKFHKSNIIVYRKGAIFECTIYLIETMYSQHCSCQFPVFHLNNHLVN